MKKRRRNGAKKKKKKKKIPPKKQTKNAKSTPKRTQENPGELKRVRRTPRKLLQENQENL